VTTALNALAEKYAAYIARACLPNPVTAEEFRARRNVCTQWHEARAAVQMEFAQLNGWRIANKGFSANSLRYEKGCSRDDYNGYDSAACDHPEWYRRDRRAICIVAHLYSLPARRAAHIAWATANGLRMHEHPDADASWYYPGGTRVVAYTSTGIKKVIWPRMDAQHTAEASQ
jgi:hypothetical protein